MMITEMNMIDEKEQSRFSNCTIIAFAKSAAAAGGSFDDRQVSSIYPTGIIVRIVQQIIAIRRLGTRVCSESEASVLQRQLQYLIKIIHLSS